MQNETDLAFIRALYGRPMEVFSNLLRLMIKSAPGKMLYSADYAAIEARVLFWLAGHAEGVKAFAENRPLYEEMAAVIFKVALEKVTKEQRQLGKQAILGCFSADTLVLTQEGWVRIVDLKLTDFLWDGEEWVSHQGVMFQGVKQTIKLAGIRATPDHQFLTAQGWKPFRELEEKPRCLKSALELAGLKLKATRAAPVVAFLKYWYLVSVNRKKFMGWTPIVLNADTQLNVILAQKKLLKKLENFIGVMKKLCPTLSTGRDYLTGFRLQSDVAIIQNQKHSNIMAHAELKSFPNGEMTEENFCDMFKQYRGGMLPNWKWTELITLRATILKILDSLRRRPMPAIKEQFAIWKTKLNDSKKLLPVYDVLNAGPRNRFCVLSNRGPLIAHNCGFGMGWKKFIETCANYDMIVSEELARTAINAYRDLHKPVPKLWAMIEKASIYATTHPGKRVTVNKTKWFIEGDYLFCELPSGRRLAYYGPKIRPHKTSWGETKASLHHWGVDPKTKQWVFGPTYGGKLVENIVQATARDLMAAAMLEIEKADYEIILSVHDEVVAEKTNGDLKEFETIMSTIPAWANGLPVKVSGWEGERYRKG